MRYFPIGGLTTGMVCGRNLYDVNNQQMLRSSSMLRQSYIDTVRNLRAIQV